MNYGLIGEHLGHSYSKEIHASLADYEYELKELKPEEVDGFMRAKAFKAINVTIPYKQTVIPYLDWTDPAAMSIGAVNTVVNRDGKLYGWNTDFAGMKALALKLGLDMKGKKVLILGSGGTSKTAMAVAEDLGAAEIYKLSRSAKDGCISYEEAIEKHKDAAFIINTTPAGMYPKVDGKAIDISAFPKLEGGLDAVYNPLRSNFVLDCQERGIPCEGGLYMLSAQAVYACGHFLNKEMGEAETEKAYKEVLSGKQNIVFVGMPSSGKTTIGNIVAEKTGKQFVDTDDLITDCIGMSISDFMKENGEPAFRDIESSITAGTSLKTGLVIATGGGAILRPENIRALKQNGILVWLDRSLEKLTPTSDRPLSSDIEALKKRYEERYDIYKSCCDIRIDGDMEIEQVAAEVLERLK